MEDQLEELVQEVERRNRLFGSAETEVKQQGYARRVESKEGKRINVVCALDERYTKRLERERETERLSDGKSVPTGG